MYTTEELNAMGNYYFPNSFMGVYPRLSIPLIRKNVSKFQCFIINTDTKNLPGSHWVAIIIHPFALKTDYFDSFGDAPIVPLPVDHLWYNQIQVQPITSTLCRLYCIYFLYYRLLYYDIHPTQLITRIFNCTHLYKNKKYVLDLIQ